MSSSSCAILSYRETLLMYLSSATWYLQPPRFSDKSGQSVLAALNQSSLPGVPATFQDAIDSGHVRESMQVGTCPRWTSDSRTTLIVSQTQRFLHGPAWPASSGLPSTGFSPATCSRRGRCCHPSAASFETRPPMTLAEEAMMHIHAGVPVSVHFIATVRTPEQFPPFHSDALAVLEGEPLPHVATASAILTGPMRVDFDGDSTLHEGFLVRV